MATTAAITAGPASFLPVGALDDDALARRINAGDDRAFEELYSRYYPRLYRYCASVLGDPQEAEEALQSSMFSAYRALRAHDRELNLRPWLYRIAHNQCLDIMRRRRETDELSGLEEERGLNVSEQVDLREDVRQLRRDLAALAPEQREALVLREMGGLSHEEIARTLEATPAAAKQLIHDARRSLTAFESGRSLECADVQRRLSDQDGRVLRGGAIKSHLRSCPDCGLFRETMRTRSVPMRALVPPLSPVAAQGILASVLGGTSGAAAAGGAALAGGLGAGLALKIAAVGVVAVAGVAAAGIPLGLTERIGGSDASPRARVEGQGPSGSAGAAPVDLGRAPRGPLEPRRRRGRVRRRRDGRARRGRRLRRRRARWRRRQRRGRPRIRRGERAGLRRRRVGRRRRRRRFGRGGRVRGRRVRVGLRRRRPSRGHRGRVGEHPRRVGDRHRPGAGRAPGARSGAPGRGAPVRAPGHGAPGHGAAGPRAAGRAAGADAAGPGAAGPGAARDGSAGAGARRSPSPRSQCPRWCRRCHRRRGDGPRPG